MMTTRRKRRRVRGGREPDTAGDPAAAIHDLGPPAFSNLISDLIHDFRAPLGSIVGAASTLDDYAGDIDAATRSRLCASIINDAQRLDRLLTSLAAIAKAKSGALLGEERRVELNELLRGLAAKARERYGRPVRIAVQANDIFMTTDPAALHALVFAMLDLACEYASEDSGGAELVLSEDAGAAFVRLNVASAAREDHRPPLRRLLERDSAQPSPDSRATPDVVFLAAIREVIQILGGEFSVQYDDGSARLHQTVRLPIHTS